MTAWKGKGSARSAAGAKKEGRAKRPSSVQGEKPDLPGELGDDPAVALLFEFYLKGIPQCTLAGSKGADHPVQSLRQLPHPAQGEKGDVHPPTGERGRLPPESGGLWCLAYVYAGADQWPEAWRVAGAPLK